MKLRTLAGCLRALALPVLAAAGLGLPACAAPPAPNPAEVTAAVESFYAAIKKGDSAAAMSQIAPDAVFVESGKLETRAEYESNHLPADIEFESQVTGKRHPMQVSFKGDAAWVIALTDYAGTFEGDPVDFVSAQLVVLTRDSGAWRIRSIHWSSRPNIPG
jgi:ketosteroid isomerase-like protein